MKYAAAAKPSAARRAPLVVTLKPSAWADTWDEKASAPSVVGVRLVSEADLARARGEGERAAARLHPRLDERSPVWVEAFNQAVMHHVLGHALCRHDDVSAPLFEMQDFVISHRLSVEGTKRLWDAVEELGVVDSPLTPEISDAGAEELATFLTQDAWWEGMDRVTRRRAARLLQRVLEMGTRPPA